MRAGGIRRVALCAVSIGLAMSAAASTASAAGTANVSCTTGSGGGFVIVSNNVQWAQTFTPDASGKLLTVDIVRYARAPGGSGGDVNVRLFGTDGSGVPVHPALATTAIPAASIVANNTFQTYAANFAPASAWFLDAGTTYAIGVSTPDTAQNAWGNRNDTCPGTLYVDDGTIFELSAFLTSGEDAEYATYLGPENDDYARPVTLAGESDTDDGTTAGGTRETDEPDHYTTNPPDSDFWVGDHSVWYRWVALGSGPTILDVCTANIDSILAVYEGDSGTAFADLDRVADNNNDVACPAGTFGSFLTFNAEVGNEYRIAVGDAGGARENTFTLALAGPANEPPVITPLKPRPGSKTRKKRPRIKARATDSVTALSAARFDVFVDGVARPNVAYDPATDIVSARSQRLKPGRHKAKVKATDGSDSASKTWRFKVKRRR